MGTDQAAGRGGTAGDGRVAGLIADIVDEFGDPVPPGPSIADIVTARAGRGNLPVGTTRTQPVQET